MKSVSNVIVLVAWAILIAACGGGGGGSTPLSANALLSSLSVTGGTLDPAFSPAVTNYTASVPFGGLAILGSFGESSVASRRKRGPVAFRPRLSAGLALSMFIVLLLYA